jgi:hypothetical protein
MFHVGDRVRVERNETRWRRTGSWRRYKGRTGTVVSLNTSDGEIGVSWLPSAPARSRKTDAESWFLPHELKKVT